MYKSGQWGLSYQDEVCTGDSAAMTCDVNPDMTITAASSVGDLPPFQCAPKESASDFTGHWDADAGALSEIFPYANRKGVLHYEGRYCCTSHYLCFIFRSQSLTSPNFDDARLLLVGARCTIHKRAMQLWTCEPIPRAQSRRARIFELLRCRCLCIP